MATPEWFAKLKRRTAEIIDFENDALERDMVRTQETPSETHETEEDIARRVRLERERQEEEEIAARLHEWNSRNVSRVSRGVYCALCVLICVTMIALLMFTVMNLPSFGSPNHPINNEVSARYIEKGLQETGAVNIVTGMILDYRAFDTLGESTVLFTAAMVVLFLLPLLAAARWRTALNFGVTYAVLTALGMLDPDALGLPWLHVVSALAVGVTMMLPCFITGAYAFSTTRVSEFVCALRRMRVPESVAIPCMVVIRFFPTIGRDYRRTRDAMALRGLASGRLALLRHPAQSLEFVLVPLLMNATIVSRDLSVAALTKGLGRFGRHTCITEIHSVGLIGRRWRSARSRWH